jgi:glycerate dehydrogenase
MKGVFLDAGSMGTDLDFLRLKNSMAHFQAHSSSASEDVVPRLQGAHIAIVNKVLLGDKEFAACPALKLVAVTATGTNNIDLAAARARGIRVCNVIQYGRPTIVQHTFSLILALANHLLDYVNDVRRGEWQKSPVFCMMHHPIIELEGKTIGIIGYGDLGRGVARMAEAFGMKVLLGARPAQKNTSVDGYSRLPLHELLPQVDVLSLHCLLSDETRNLIDARALSLMKPSAFLINVARGGLVDEAALAKALREQRLAGAATDVLSQEPPVNGNPLFEPGIPNLIITPHCAWASREARQRLLDKTADNIEGFLQGRLDCYIV